MVKSKENTIRMFSRLAYGNGVNRNVQVAKVGNCQFSVGEYSIWKVF